MTPGARTALRIAAAITMLSVASISLVRGLQLRYDFEHFYLDARHAWEHGAVNQAYEADDEAGRPHLPFYLPCVPLLLAPLTAGGVAPAAVGWTALQFLSLAICLRLGWRWLRGEAGDATDDDARRAILLLVLTAPAIYEAARFNQLSFPLLAMVWLGIDAAGNRKQTGAGIWLGLAAVLKLLPGVFVLWLVAKRAWRSLAVFCVVFAVLAAAPCLIALGPSAAWRAHANWAAYNFGGAAGAGMTDARLRDHFIDHRNESVTAVVARLTWADHPHATQWRPLSLSQTTARRLGQGIAVLLAVGLLAAVWLAGRNVDRVRRLAEAATFALAMLIFSPLLRTYYLVWTGPALALAGFWLAPRASRSERLRGGGVLVFWLSGMIGWLMEDARLIGVHLWMLIAIGVLLLLTPQGAKAPSGSDSEAAPRGAGE